MLGKDIAGLSALLSIDVSMNAYPLSHALYVASIPMFYGLMESFADWLKLRYGIAHRLIISSAVDILSYRRNRILISFCMSLSFPLPYD
jgi:hypothetical protein